MTRVIILESFEDDFAMVSSKAKRAKIIEAVALLERVPQRGSRDLPQSVLSRFGHTRKIVVSPFDIIYTYDAESDTAVVQGIVHQRGAF